MWRRELIALSPLYTLIAYAIAIPEAHHKGAKFFCSINMPKVVTRTVRVSSKPLRAGEKNPHKLYIFRMLNARTLGWC